MVSNDYGIEVSIVIWWFDSVSMIHCLQSAATTLDTKLCLPVGHCNCFGYIFIISYSSALTSVAPFTNMV